MFATHLQNLAQDCCWKEKFAAGCDVGRLRVLTNVVVFVNELGPIYRLLLFLRLNPYCIVYGLWAFGA